MLRFRLCILLAVSVTWERFYKLWRISLFFRTGMFHLVDLALNSGVMCFPLSAVCSLWVTGGDSSWGRHGNIITYGGFLVSGKKSAMELELKLFTLSEYSLSLSLIFSLNSLCFISGYVLLKFLSPTRLAPLMLAIFKHLKNTHLVDMI